MAKQSIPFFLSLLAALSLIVACQPTALDEIIDPNPQEPEVVPERTTIPYSLALDTEATRVSWVTSTNSYQFKEGDKLQVKGLGDRTDIEGTLTQSSGSYNWSGEISYLTSKGAPADNTQLEITLLHADNPHPETYATALVGELPEGVSGDMTLLQYAVENYSLFTTQVAFNAHAGTLLQQATFLELDVTFDFDGTHHVEPGEALLDLRTEEGEATGRTPFIPLDNNEDFKVQFVAVIPGGKTTGAFSLTIGDRAVTFTQFDKVLERNNKYKVSRTVDYGPQLGDPFWSDGTYGRLDHSDPNVAIVGIIVYVNHNYSSNDPKAAIDDAITEKTADNKYGHGLVMALKNVDAGAGIAWSNPSTQSATFTTPVTNPVQTMEAASLRGFTNTNAIIAGFASMNTHVVSAASKAQSYNVELSEGSNTTGWFLPSIGQWMFAISMDGFGGANHTDLWTNNAKPPKNWKKNGTLSDLIRVMSNEGEDNNLLVDSLNERLEKLSREFGCQYDPFGIPKTGSDSSVNYSDNYWSSSEYNASQAIRMNFGSVEEDYATIKVKPENKTLTYFLNDPHYPARVRPFLAF